MHQDGVDRRVRTGERAVRTDQLQVDSQVHRGLERNRLADSFSGMGFAVDVADGDCPRLSCDLLSLRAAGRDEGVVHDKMASRAQCRGFEPSQKVSC